MTENKFSGVTPDLKMQTIEIDRCVAQGNNFAAKIQGQMTYGEVFDELKSHLEYVGLLPDEYFILSSEINKDENIPKGWRFFRTNTMFGGSEGIYIDIELETDAGVSHFATGKTLNENTDDYMQMCKIAGECYLMLNGNGGICELPKDIKDKLIERNITHGEVCNYSFFVTSLDDNNGYRNEIPSAVGLSAEQAQEEYIRRKELYPGNTTLLGVEYVTDRRDLTHTLAGGAILLRYNNNGNESLLDDFVMDTILSQEETLKPFISKLKSSLSETETKLKNAGLVSGNINEIHSKTTDVAREIVHHNELEDEDLIEDDQWDL